MARLFISFAAEDVRSRDFLTAQSKLPACPFEFTDMSVKTPWDSAWKTNCRTKIRGCNGVIALLSKKTWNADGARWEIQCARDEGIPVLGVHIYKDDKGAVPPELAGCRVIEWSWPGIHQFIRSL